MRIPFIDLAGQYEALRKEIDPAIQRVLVASSFIGGKPVQEFETNFKAYLGAKYCIGVGNGTDALFIALKALGIGSGDEVITAANSFIATSEAITAAGAKVVFVDCHPDYYTIEPQKIEERITPRTKAIIPVHLYGQPAPMETIVKTAERHGIRVIEDCAQAHGAALNGKKIGLFGDLGCFSFYPGKNLGAYGDAGAIVAHDELLSKRCRMLANHGRLEKYNHEFEGFNSRLDGIQAAILNVKLHHLEEWNEKRRALAEIYRAELGRLSSIVLPQEAPGSRHVYHLFVIRSKHRDDLRAFLKDHEIETGVHYPIGLPFLKAYEYLHHRPEDFPVTFQYQHEVLSLPMYPEMTDEAARHVAGTIRAFYQSLS